MSMSLPDINQQSRATGLRIVSWNISGVLDQIKRGVVLRQAKRYFDAAGNTPLMYKSSVSTKIWLCPGLSHRVH